MVGGLVGSTSRERGWLVSFTSRDAWMDFVCLGIWREAFFGRRRSGYGDAIRWSQIFGRMKGQDVVNLRHRVMYPFRSAILQIMDIREQKKNLPAAEEEGTGHSLVEEEGHSSQVVAVVGTTW